MTSEGLTVGATARRSLPGEYYRDPDIFRLEYDRVFARSWFFVGRSEAVEDPRGYLSIEVVDQPIVVLRDREGVLRAFHNVCRHRGSLLVDPGRGQLRGAIKCPYHAWTYGLDGALVSTPHVGDGEIDCRELGLAPIRVESWQGCLFVNLSGDAPPLEQWLDEQEDQPCNFERWDLGSLRVAHTTVAEIKANWKILIENYAECLHCPGVHPELVALIPAYRSGSVSEGREDFGVSLATRSSALTATGATTLPALPHLTEQEAASYYGAFAFPNAFLDVSGTFATLTALLPRAADHTTLVTEYLFAPETMAADGFDPSDVIAFNELVIAQDNGICERVQRGVASRSFVAGVYPDKDSGPHEFDQFYLRHMEAAGAAEPPGA